jgi:O-Antigen ligase
VSSVLLLNALVAVGLLAGLFAFVYLALRSAATTVCVLVGLWIGTTALTNSLDLSWTASGTRIAALDVMSVVLAAVGLSRALTIGLQNAGKGIVLALFGLLAVHIARGIAAFGTQTAMNTARGWLYFTAVLLYVATAPKGWDGRIWKIMMAGGAVLALASIPYLAIDGVHTATHVVFRHGEWVTSRPVTAAGALLILQSAILALSLGWPSRRTAPWVAGGEIVLLILLQHRTLWAAAVAAGLIGFVSWSARRVQRSPEAVFAATGLVLLALPLVAWAFLSSGALVSSAKEAVSNNSTFTWRTTSWSELISSHHSYSQVAVGEPSGTSWKREIAGEIVDRSPHNGFVDAYLRFGLPGVIVLCSLGILLWRRRDSLAAGAGLPSSTVALLLLTQIAFSVAYTLDLVQAIVCGVLVSGLATASPARSRIESYKQPFSGSYEPARP